MTVHLSLATVGLMLLIVLGCAGMIALTNIGGGNADVRSLAPAQQEEADHLERALASGQLDAEESKSAEYKLNSIRQEEADRTAGAQNAAPKTGPSALPPPPQSHALPPHETGIVTPQQPPVSSGQARITNEWVGDQPDGSTIEVFAGAISVPGINTPSRQGILIAITYDGKSPVVTPNERFEIPGEHGIATITAASGDVLTITSDDGAVTRFDACARKFIP